MPRTSFAGKTALVTGGSSGIGLEIARLLLREKARLILVASNSQKLEAARVLLEKEFGVPILSIARDLSDTESARMIYDQLKAQGISVDVLVNNAGYGDFGFYHKTSLDNFLKMVDVNVKALMALTHHFVPGMIERRSGWVLNVASTAGFQSIPMQATYGATKAFVLSFSEALSEELRSTGVRVTCLCPGATNTDFFKRESFRGSKITKNSRMSSDDVARIGIEALRNGRPLVIAGLMNNLMVWSERFVPRRIVTKMARMIVAGRHTGRLPQKF